MRLNNLTIPYVTFFIRLRAWAKTILGFIPFLFFIIFLPDLFAQQTGVIYTDEVIVRFEVPLQSAAKEVTRMVGGIKRELEKTFGWTLDIRPDVVLVKKTETFQKIVGSNLVVAIAIPKHNRVVIDYSKMNTHPFTLGITLKHELCHLLLHHHIKRAGLPKWLDEGICQWVSDGIAEIIRDPNRSLLSAATLSGNYIPLNRLSTNFPEDKRSLLLAYEQSKSLVAYINKTFGSNKVVDILKYLERGHEVETALPKALSITIDEFENRWRSNLRKKTTWVSYLAANLYVILFFLGALMTIFGFIRYWLKKKRYPDEDEDSY